jgi:quercetin dioxygenase-like cupin family protein
MRLLPLLILLSVAVIPGRAASNGVVVHKVFGQASAAPNTALAPGTVFTTGAHSKSELSLPKAVARVGQRAALESSAGGLVLRQGMTLVASDPGTVRRTVEVRAPGYRLQVKGTVQVAFDPGHSLKVVVLEGAVTVSLDGLLGEYEDLHAGQMLVINPSDHRLPEPAEVDVQRLVSTSALTGGEFGPLATAGKIKAVAGAQGAALASGRLQDTGLLLRGLDNTIELEHRLLAQAPAPASRRAVDTAHNIFNGTDSFNNPRAVTEQRTFRFSQTTSTADTVENVVLARNSLNVGRTHTLLVEMQPAFGVDASDPNNPIFTTFHAPLIKGRVTVSPDFFTTAPMRLEIDATTPDDMFPQLTLSGATLFTPRGVSLGIIGGYGLDIGNSRVFTGRDAPSLSIDVVNNGLNIHNDSAISGTNVAIRGGANVTELKIDHSSVRAQRNLTIGSRTAAAPIVIRNSTELASLAANLQWLAYRGPITIDSPKSVSARRNLLIDAFIKDQVDGSGQPITTPGLVNILGGLFVADNLRVRGYAQAGDAVIINGSTMRANQLLELFAEGGGALRFQGDVTLQAKLAKLAGAIVQVDPHGTVTIKGKGRVYTNDARFNTGTWGTISATRGLSPTAKYEDRGKF